MESRAYSVLVVGAGIAGLSASIALAEKGYDVTILEGAPQVKTLLMSLLCISSTDSRAAH
jgi:succinate dehydrogenase/fumarate reductase flavoprotein subunit